MRALTVIFIFLPFLLGFIAYLLPRTDRFLATTASLLSIVCGGIILVTRQEFSLVLMGNFGVSLTVDNLSGYFILTNGLVTLAVVIYAWLKSKSPYFYTQLTILHGSVNSVFCCADFITLYVSLEVIAIATSLLISYPRTNRSIWIGLRYLLVSNTVMLFYLVGVVLVFQAQGSFAFTALDNASPEATSLILLGLLTKGGIFLSGMWLPLTHAESESPVSATLSGIVVKTGIFPIIRCAQMVEELTPIVEIFSTATATLGVVLGIFCTDIKRIFAFSTISQLGYILAGNATAGFYALAHGLAKAGLFLTSSTLPSRQVGSISGIPFSSWLVLVVCSLSIMGVPGLVGFSAKDLVLTSLPPWQSLWLNICSIGTSIILSPVLLLPLQGKKLEMENSPGIFLSAILVMGSFLYLNSYRWDKISQTLILVGLGAGIYYLILRRLKWNYFSPLEKLDNLLSLVTIVAILIFSLIAYELP
ncbi:MAG: cation:proton antiporter [Pseudanabaenaceae cyanobacterium SKYGB_i_bin29]|nr:cation:proton antiporter [Pseudanabaenaceae cyanobacterium SKYG29]MDW8421793.1 cation:proton antiporter [Pseudanabaenaceae cyanobacterium SKYGB_i_bin29]